MTAERWLPVAEFPGYEVSDHGRVRSVDRVSVHKNGRRFNLRGRVLQQGILPPRGYRTVHMGAGSRTGRYVHRLVLDAFVGLCPDGMEGCHKNCDTADNRLSNLRWDTKSGNAADTIRLGRKREQKKTHCPRRHPLALPNLVTAQLPNRKCKACNRARAWVQRGGDLAHFQAISDAYFAEIMKEASAA